MFYKNNPPNKQPAVSPIQQPGKMPAVSPIQEPNKMPNPAVSPIQEPNKMPNPAVSPIMQPGKMPAVSPIQEPNKMPMPMPMPAVSPIMQPNPNPAVSPITQPNPNPAVSPITQPGKMPGGMAGGMMQHPCFTPEMAAGAEEYQMMYPESYYKIHPHVMMACDEMDMHGVMMPTKKMMMCMCNHIYENVCMMHPEMREEESMPTAQYGYYTQQPRRFGGIRDIIFILLLSEFFRRRRRF